MNELIIAEIKKVHGVPLHHFTVIGKLNLTSLRYAIEKARNSYLDILSEPDLDAQSKKAFTNEVNIMQEFLKELKFIDHELPGINVQRTEKEPNS